jgi:hypothetical protein
MAIAVTNVQPASLANVQPADTLSFDVTSTTGLLRIIVCIGWPVETERAPELAHDGNAFQALYIEGSTRTAVAGGFRYVLRRAGGWYAAPAPLIFAVDSAGQEL